MYRITLLIFFILYSILTGVSQVPVNDDCGNAISIQCGDLVSGSTTGSVSNFNNTACFNEFDPTVWYKFAGDGQVQTFKYVSSEHSSLQLTIVSETCSPGGSFFCKGNHYLSQGDSVRINTEPDVEYFLMIENGCCGDSGEFEFSMHCAPTIENDLCSEALPLSCNENISLYLNDASSEQTTSFCSSRDVNDVWFKMSGDDMFHVFEIEETENSFISVDIYKGDCDTRFDFCPESIEINIYDSFNSFYAESGEEYVIRFYSRSEVSDTINIEHICMLPAMNDQCENAEPFNCGEKLIGNTRFASFSDEYNGCHSENIPDVWYSFIGDGMLHILSADTIEGGSINFDIYQGDCNTEYTDCIQSFLSQSNDYIDASPYNFYAESGVSYLIRPYNYENGYFEISNDCMVPLENDLCENAIAISCDEFIEGDMKFSSFSSIDYPCNNNQGEYDLWYSIIGDGLIHSFSIDSLEFNSISIGITEGACKNISSDCLDFFNLSNQSEYSFLAEAGKEYLLRFSSSQPGGFFRLHHACSEQLSNDDCHSPAPLTCGEQIMGSTATATISSDINNCYYINANDVWYSLEGDGLTHVFSLANSPDGEVGLYIYEGSCNRPVDDCNRNFSLYEDVNFYAESGKSYLIRLTAGCCGTYYNYEIKHECLTPIVNDECIDAIEISCEESLTVNLSIATPTYSSFCGSTNDNDLWYKVIGNGQLIFLKSESSNPVVIDVFENSCPTDFSSCPTSLSLEAGNNNFLAELDQYYYIRLSYYTTLSPFSLIITCEDIASNNECADAFEIECDQDIIGNTSLALDSEISNGCGFNRNKDLWYRIDGDGNIHSFSLMNSTIERVVMSITTNKCEETQDDCMMRSLNPNSEISLVMELGQEYYIIISGDLHDDQGSFNISHDCYEPVLNDFCHNAEIIQCEQVIEGNTKSASNSMDFVGCRSSEKSDLWYFISGSGMIHSFDYLSSESGCVSIDIFESSCPGIYGQCIFSSYLQASEQFKFLDDTGSDYLIRITTCNELTGAFEIEYTCNEAIQNDLCSNAIALTCDDRISGNTALAFNTNEYNGCNREDEGDLWYSITGDDMVHVFEIKSLRTNLSMDIYEGECGAFEECVMETRFYGGKDGTSFFASSGKEYLIRVYYQFNNSGGSFLLDYSCELPPDNNNCLNATPISCNEDQVDGDLTYATGEQGEKDVWYSLIGDDQLHMFLYLAAGNFTSVEIYKQACDGDLNTALINESLSLGNDPVSFIAESGISYLIRIVQRQSNIGGKFSFLHMCMDQLENDLCLDALPINCGEIFSGSTQNATSRNIYNGCVNENRDDVWYKIEGDNQFHYFELLDLDATQIIIDVFSGNCEIPPGGCSQQLRFYKEDDNHFFAENDITYFLRVSSRNFGSDKGFGYFEFNYSCYALAENNECVTAMPIACGDLIQGNTRTATVDQNRDDCYRNLYSDLWYSIQGDNQIHTFKLVDYEKRGIRLTVFEDHCDSTICLSSWYLRQFDSYASFKTESDQTYLVSISSDCCNNEGYFEFEYNCQEPVINDECNNAITLLCGDEMIGTLINTSFTDVITDCVDEADNDVWYTLLGDGLPHGFRLVDPLFSPIKFQLFRNSCEDRYEFCNEQLLFTDNNFDRYFMTEADTEYLVRLSSSLLVDYNYEHLCIDIEEFEAIVPQNDQCSDATDIVCGELLSINFENATPDDLYRECGFSFTSSPGLWYKFIGDGSILTIDGSVNNSAPYIYVYEDDCLNTVCTDNRYQYFSDREVSIKTDLDKTYYILVRSSSFNELVQLSVECSISTVPNELTDDLCEEAIPITCGSSYDVVLKPASFLNESSGCDFENQNEVWFTYFGVGQNVVITTEANEFYSLYVNVFEGNCNRDLINCSFSNVMFPGNNKASFFAERGVEYIIRAFSFKSTTAALSLLFECGQESENSDCQDAIEITCGESFSGNLLIAGHSESFRGCNDNDFPDLWYSLEGDGLVHGFSRSGNTGRPLTIEFYAETCTGTYDVCESVLSVGGSTEYFATQVNTDYYLRIYNTSNLDSEFVMDHVCGDPIPNDVCNGAVLLSCQDTIGESTDFLAISEIDNTFCPATTADLWYLIEGDNKFHEFSRLFFTFEQEQFTIFESASDCLSFYNEPCSNSFTLSENIDSYSFFAEPNINYFIRVSAGMGESFISFIHNCEDQPVNDVCQESTSLLCGDTLSGNTIFAKPDSENSGCDYSVENDLWYSITGDDSQHAFEYISSSTDQIIVQVYDGTCDDYYNNCVKTIRLNDFYFSNSFFAELGKEYLIKVYADCCEPGTFSILHSCHGTPSNDLCMNAESINCEDRFMINLHASTYDPIYSDCHNRESGDVWYTFEGDGLVKVFSVDSTRNYNAGIDFYAQECTNKYSCIDQIGFTSGFMNQGFLTESGVTYFMRVYTSFQDITPSFNLTMSCMPLAPSDSCESAEELVCGQHYSGSTIGATHNDNFKECYNLFGEPPLVWYKVVGNNSNVQLALTSNDFNPVVNMYKGGCDKLSCLYPTFRNSNTNVLQLSFDAEKDSIYYMAVSSSREESGLFELSITCEPIPDNNRRANASAANCNELIEGSIINASADVGTDSCSDDVIFNPGVWYSFSADNDSIELEFTQLGFSPTVQLFEIVVNSFQCVSYKSLDGNGQMIDICQSSTQPSFSLPCLIVTEDTISIPIIVNNLEDVIKMDLVLTFDSSAVSFVGFDRNIRGGINYYYDHINDEVTILWQNDTMEFINGNSSIIGHLQFTKKENEVTYSELIISDKSTIRVATFGGYREGPIACLDHGMIAFEEDVIVCDQSLKTSFKTTAGKDYLLYISGADNLDDGDFSFTMNCARSEEITVIPTLTQWGLICLGLLFLIFGIVAIKDHSPKYAS